MARSINNRRMSTNRSARKSKARSARRSAMRSPRRSAMRSPRRSARRSAMRSPRRSSRRSAMRSPRRSSRRLAMRSPRRSAMRSPRRSNRINPLQHTQYGGLPFWNRNKSQDPAAAPAEAQSDLDPSDCLQVIDKIKGGLMNSSEREKDLLGFIKSLCEKMELLKQNSSSIGKEEIAQLQKQLEEAQQKYADLMAEKTSADAEVSKLTAGQTVNGLLQEYCRELDRLSIKMRSMQSELSSKYNDISTSINTGEFGDCKNIINLTSSAKGVIDSNLSAIRKYKVRREFKDSYNKLDNSQSQMRQAVSGPSPFADADEEDIGDVSDMSSDVGSDSSRNVFSPTNEVQGQLENRPEQSNVNTSPLVFAPTGTPQAQIADAPSAPAQPLPPPPGFNPNPRLG